MNWICVENYEEMSRYAAGRIHDVLGPRMAGNERFNLGLATGNTMLGLCERLAAHANEQRTPLLTLHTYNLDEYVGPDGVAVPDTHPLSYRKYMRENLFDRFDPVLGLEGGHVHFPDPVDPAHFDAELEADGGLDFQLLGIGFNGHIAFNEPIPEKEMATEDFAALPSRIVALEELTIQTNSRLTAGNDDALVPRHAVTMGMRQILAAKEILLLACFPEQLKSLTAMLHGAPTPELPASYLLDHPSATIVYTRDVIPLDIP